LFVNKEIDVGLSSALSFNEQQYEAPVMRMIMVLIKETNKYSNVRLLTIYN